MIQASKHTVYEANSRYLQQQVEQLVKRCLPNEAYGVVCSKASVDPL